MRVDRGVSVPIPKPSELWTVGAVILNKRGLAYIHRRAPDRALMPGCWDIVGGHVEPNESIIRALKREIREETGWSLRRIALNLGEWRWTGPDGRVRDEVDYLVRVSGDLSNPRLQAAEHDRFAWVGVDQLDFVLGDPCWGQEAVLKVVRRGLRLGKTAFQTKTARLPDQGSHKRRRSTPTAR